MSDVVCATCGDRFTPPAELLERYPGWQPRQCPRCYRAKGRATPAPPTDAAGAARRGGRRGPRGPGDVEDHLTVAQVLARYSDGPDDGVFTDGAANPNPGPGGWGAVWVVDGEVRAQDYGHEPHTTNNRMELVALHRGIELVPPGTPVTVYSDSNLVVRTVTEWAAGWERRGWKRKTGPVENLDLVRPLYELLQRRPEIEVVWIKAHAGNRWNEYADALATAYAREEL